MSGNQWSPNTDLNPAKNWDYVTGLVGLVYETPFRYDPLKDKFIPWLATKGKWVGKNFVVTLRPGITWNDGKPFTAADVKFTFETGKLEGSQYSTMWKTGLSSITTRGNVVTFRFSGTPN
jgi:peptide/nickel transport system substrate-binding protein